MMKIKLIILVSSLVCIFNLIAQTPKLGLPSGLSGSLNFVNFNAKGNKLVSVTSDNVVKIWDAHSGKCLTEIELDLFPDYAIFAGDDHKIIMACSISGPKTLEQKAAELTIAMDDKRKPQAGYIVTWTLYPENKIDSFKIADYENVKWMELDQREEKLLLLSETRKRITIINQSAARVILSINAENAGTAVKSLEEQLRKSIKNGNVDADKIMKIASNTFNIKSLTQSKAFRSAHFSADGKKIVTGADNGPAIIWNIVNLDKLQEIKTAYPSVLCALFDKAGKTVLTASFNENTKKLKIELWNAETGKLQDSLVNLNDIIPSTLGLNAYSGDIHISSDWKFISDYTRMGELGSFMQNKSKIKRKFSSNPPHLNYSTSVFNTNSKLIAWYNRSGAYVTDFHTSHTVSNMKGDVSLVNIIQVSPDGKKIFTSLDNIRSEVRDLSSGRTLFTVKPGNCFFNSDNNLVQSNERETNIFDAETGYLRFNQKGNFSSWSSDGSRALSIKQFTRSMTVWNIKEKRQLLNIELPRDNMNVYFCSNDEKFVGTEASRDMKAQHVYILDSKDGKHVKIFDSASADIVFNEQKNKVLIIKAVSTGKAHLVIYDIEKDQQIFCMQQFPLLTAAYQYQSKGKFSPDSKKLVVGNKETVFLLDALTGKSIAEFSTKKNEARRSGNNDYEYVESQFSPNSKFVMVGARIFGIDRPINRTDKLIVYSTETGKPVLVKDGIEGMIKTTLFTPDNKLLVFGEFGVASSVYDLPSGEKLFSLENSEQKPLASAFSKDARFMYSSYSDGAVKIHQASSGKLNSSMYLFDSTANLSMLPSGYYYTSKPGRNSIYYVSKDLKIITFDQLDLKFNRPDIVLQSMGNINAELIDAYSKTYYNRLERNGIESLNMTKDISVPDADFVDRDDLQFKELNGKLELHIRAVDKNYPITRFNLWVNEVPLFGKEGIKIYRRKNVFFDTTITVILSPNKNKLETSVYNSNAIESYRAALYVTNINVAPKPAKLWFVGIAVDNYAIPDYNKLKYTVNDIRSVAAKLKEKNGGKIIIDTLLNNQFTLLRLRELKEKLANSSVDDKIIVMYSGHGILDNAGHYYFPTSSMTKEDFKQAISYEIVENLLNNIPSRNKLMLIDACHSGIYDKNSESVLNDSKTTTQIMDQLFSYVGRGTGATVISSSSGDELSLESDEFQHGYFTQAILEALDLYGSAIKVSVLKKYLAERGPKISKGLQNPGIRSENKEMDFEL